MPSVEFAIQKAIDAVLVAALAAIPALPSGATAVPVYDHAPQGARYPYVRFGRKISTAENLLAADVTRVQVALSVFSNFKGQEEVDEILALVRDALDDARLELDTGRAVRCDLERADTTLDADGVTYMGSAIYAVLAEH